MPECVQPDVAEVLCLRWAIIIASQALFSHVKFETDYKKLHATYGRALVEGVYWMKDFPHQVALLIQSDVI